MSEPRGAQKTVDLLNELRETVTSYAAKEKSLQRTFNHITGGQDLPHEALLEEEQTRHEAALAAQETYAAKRRQDLSNWDENRRARMRTVLSTARIERLERIEAEKGREVVAVQQGRLAAGRDQATALQENDQQLAALGENLEQARLALLGLQRKARSSFRGYGRFRRQMMQAQAEPWTGGDANAMIEAFNGLYPQTVSELERFRRRPAPAVFRIFPLWALLLVLAAAAGSQAVPTLAVLPLIPTVAIAVVIGALLVVWHFFGGRQAQPAVDELTVHLAELTQLYEGCVANAQQTHQAEAERIQADGDRQLRELEARWKAATHQAETRKAAMKQELSGKEGPLKDRHDALFQSLTERQKADHANTMARLETEHQARIEEFTGSRESRVQRQLQDNQARWQETEQGWNETIPQLTAEVAAAAEVGQRFADWTDPSWENWTPPEQFGNAIPFGRLTVDLQAFCEVVPQDDRLPLTVPETFTVPVLLRFPEEGSLLIETTRSCGDSVATALNGLLLRLLAESPAGRLNFTILDPVGLGQNFAGIMHLADYEDSLINKRIWTQSAEIEQKLSDLNKHIEKVIQLNLRNEYPTIREYNEQAGNIAEKYHFLVVADFPVNFSETALRHLVNILVSGARCGVFTLIHWDRRHEVPRFVLDELHRNSLRVTHTKDGFELENFQTKGATLALVNAPAPEIMTRFLHQVGLGWKDSNRIEVPFSCITPSPEEIWSLDTAEELRIPVGRAGAAKLQYLAIGKGTRQHALIGGKTGSGKSTLFHVMVTNLALWCSPDQVEFYLVDFKKGVEFKCYATHHLPHARVVAIESDREFGLGVLQRVDEELRRRGDLFRKLGVQNLAGYRAAEGGVMPRTLLLIDEFQEYFVEDDRISQEANVLLDRVVRQGRAFGIHVILGSQTLGGAYTLARATMGQMVIRIALQCNEADAQLIMDDTNPAPRFLTRPGEGIYNDMAGAVEGNSPFQTVWLSEEDRDEKLAAIVARAKEVGTTAPPPFVFEGNAPAALADNTALAALQNSPPTTAPAIPRFWIGEPNAIKGPTEIVMPRQSGTHLLVVGQAEEPVMAMLSAALIALAAQHPAGSARFVWLDSSATGSVQRDALDRLLAKVDRDVTVARPPDLADTLTTLDTAITEQPEGPATFLFAPSLPSFKKLKQEEDFGFSMDADETANPAKIFTKLLTDGPAAGLHVLVACDTYNNVMRFIGRKPLTEFELRVLFQMNANDSASLIDSPKAGSLGLHRAVLHNGHEGTLEIFRPYAGV